MWVLGCGMRHSKLLLLLLAGCTWISESEWEERQGWSSQVTAAVDQSCALRANGQVLCWGALADDWTPQVGGWEPALYVDTGYHFTCVIADSGGLHCYGIEGEGGANPQVYANWPTDGSWGAVSVGIDHACADPVDPAEPLQCWGSDDDLLQDVPTEPMGQVDVGDGFACGITASTGRIRCWGDDEYGQVSGAPGASVWWYQVSASHSYACAVGDDCTTECWGKLPTELLVPDTHCWVEVQAGMNHACFSSEWGDLECSGSNMDGQLDVPDLDAAWVDFDVGANHSCALTEEGAVHCWGSNTVGQSSP